MRHSVSSCNFYHPSSTHQSKLGSINKSSGLSLPEVDGHTLLLLQHWWWWWSCSQVVLLRVFLPPTCGTKDSLVEGYAQGCKVKLLRSLPTLCTLVHILQMEQLLRERHPSISAQQMKENTEAGNFCKGEWSLNFILLLCFFYLLASCSLKGFCFVLFCFDWGLVFILAWLVGCAWLLLCRVHPLQGFFQGSLHLVHDTHDHHQSRCQRSMLHKCFPQLCYCCCYLNDSMSLFFFLSDSATFELQSWKKQQAAEWVRTTTTTTRVWKKWKIQEHDYETPTQNKTKQVEATRRRKTQQHSVAVRCSRMLASLARIHGSRLKCVCNPPPLRSGETRWWIFASWRPKKKRGLSRHIYTIGYIIN